MRRRTAADLLVVAVPLLALFPLRNNDLWWHLAAGRWMVARGAVPRTDVFSWTGYLGAWIDNEWLAQLLFFGALSAGELGALIALRALLFLSIALLLREYMNALRIPSMFPAALASAIALSFHWWELRPSVFSLIGLFVLLITVERARRLWILPLLFLLWANLHPGFFLGLAILVAICVVNRRLVPMTLASAVATLVNPYGWKVYVQQFAIAGNREYRALLDEWIVPPVVFLLLVIAAMVIGALSVRRVRLSRLPPFFAVATLSLTAIRFEEYFAWFGIPILLTLPLMRRHRRRVRIALPLVAAVVGWWPPAVVIRHRIATAIAVVLASCSVWRWRPRRRGRRRHTEHAIAALAVVAAFFVPVQVEPNRYPTICLDALPPDARPFNRLSFGGWLIWNGRAPLIDGRCSGQPFFFDYVAAQVRYADPLLDRWGVDYVLAAPEDGVVKQMNAAKWELVCRDGGSLLYRRKFVAPASRSEPARR